MNYNQASVGQDQLPQQAQLVDKIKTFANYNDRLGNIISAIEERLHMIHNKRSPEKMPTSGVERPMPQDALRGFEEQLNRLSYNNDWLDKLCSHLSEII